MCSHCHHVPGIQSRVNAALYADVVCYHGICDIHVIPSVFDGKGLAEQCVLARWV